MSAERWDKKPFSVGWFQYYKLYLFSQCERFHGACQLFWIEIELQSFSGGERKKVPCIRRTKEKEQGYAAGPSASFCIFLEKVSKRSVDPNGAPNYITGEIPNGPMTHRLRPVPARNLTRPCGIFPLPRSRKPLPTCS